MELASSYSPARIGRIPSTGDLLLVWNQLSREEIRKGFRRSRLSCAVSRDEGKSWEHFKNLEAIADLAETDYVPPDPDLSPVCANEELGLLPEDFASFHYPRLAFLGKVVFVSYLTHRFAMSTDADSMPVARSVSGSRLRILPVDWFYG